MRFSPDGKLLSFVSSDSGRPEVYVAPRPAPQQRVHVSARGGRLPRWGRQGRDLFFLSNDGRLMSTTISAAPTLPPSQPRAVFAVSSSSPWIDYDVAPHGRFLAIVPDVIANQQRLTVSLNWLPEK